MTESTSGGGNDSALYIALGQMMLDLAREWQQLEPTLRNLHETGLMREVYGALALELAVRAGEQKGPWPVEAYRDLLSKIQKELRAGFVDVVSKIN